MNRHPFIAAALTACLIAGGASSSEFSGTGAYVPWSGYWWPQSNRSLVTGAGYRGAPGPLQKFDAYTYREYPASASDWEEAHHRGSGGWEGHCNGWSAAAILAYEPTEEGVADGVPFRVGEKKGLLAEAGYGCDFDWLIGRRYDGINETNADDPEPALFHQALFEFIRDLGQPIVFDLQSRAEVWNYPAYAFSGSSTMEGRIEHVTMAVHFVDDGVHPDIIGADTFVRTFTYDLEWESGIIVSSRWTGASMADHPDFAWLPVSMGAENPHLDLEAVEAIAACGDDRYEGNDSPGAAVRLNIAEHRDLACLDDDFYSVTVPAGYALQVRAEFVHDFGDLDLNLLDANGAILAAADGTSDSEEVTYAGPEAATVLVQVLGYADAINGYDLLLDLSPIATAVSAPTSTAPTASTNGKGDGSCLIARVVPHDGILDALRTLRDIALRSPLGRLLTAGYYLLSA